nr:hypothetical protein GCM10020093_109450 [Planobispora longispora]
MIGRCASHLPDSNVVASAQVQATARARTWPAARAGTPDLRLQPRDRQLQDESTTFTEDGRYGCRLEWVMDVVSTAEVPAQERFAFWREVSSTTWVPYDTRCPPHLRDRFQAQIGCRRLGPVQATLMTTTPYAIHRTPKLIRQTDPEVYKLCCTVHGHGVVTRDDRQAVFGAGDLVLYDTSRPYRAELAVDIPAIQMLVLQFPRSLLPLPSRDLRRLGMAPIAGIQGISALTSQFMLHLAKHMDELTPPTPPGCPR